VPGTYARIGLVRHFPVKECLPTGWWTAAELQSWQQRYDESPAIVGQVDLGSFEWDNASVATLNGRLRRRPSTTFELLASVSWSLLVALWVVVDARRRACTPCFDFGFFCYVFFPVAVPWYCFWSRGWRGALTLVIILGLWFAPHIVASVAWIALSG
jgi:hypothetical protein